jgi:murein DD-endopeptidase MepM/ murein hydrolase activator NlpD
MPFMNHVDRPSDLSLAEIMRKVNAFGHAPRVIVELDKFSYVRGLKKKYEVVEFITKETTKNIVSIVSTGGGGTFFANAPVMPIEGKTKLSDMVITSRHRTVNPERPKHKGLDLDLAKGDPVVAVWDGRVSEVKYDEGGYGHYVTIDHGNGVKTRYAHLDATLVNVGQQVKAGQRIGLGGNSGGVVSSGGGDGSHLHFEVWKDGVDINPEPVLSGSVSLNSAVSGSTGKTTMTKATERVSYSRDLTSSKPDGKFNYPTGEYFTASTPQGAKRMLGFTGTRQPNEKRSIEFQHQWFNDGYLAFNLFYQNVTPNDKLQVLMDGSPVWTLDGNTYPGGVIYPAPITVPKGNHKFEFTMTNPQTSSSKFGIMSIKAAEYAEVEEQVEIPSVGGNVWDYEDSMGNPANWTPFASTTIKDGGDYLYFTDNENNDSGKGFERLGVVSYPFTLQVRLKVAPGTTGSNIYLSDGTTVFTPTFKPDRLETNTGIDGTDVQSYAVDNTQWQEYLLVAKDANTMIIFHKKNGDWVDTGITEKSQPYTTNRLLFYTAGHDTGTLYVDDVKYANKDYSISTPTTTVEMKTENRWYDLGGFVYDETFYLEDDIISWEVSTHLDMSSSTARVTLSNHHGLYSPEYIKSTLFPENLRDNPYTYYEEGEIRHVISEYTPVRIYAGYGDQIVRVFTGMIKGEIEEDSEARTITFNCVDRFDLLEECILLKDMSFPPEDAFNGDSVPRPWIKSSIVQALANHAGMTGWRYVWEDLQHPDLVIEETYYTDVNQRDNTFMKFDSKGVLRKVSLGDVKTPTGYRNPFVEAVVFRAGERVSDCIRRVVDEINFRVACNRYGTFIMHRLDFENNMRWDFKSGENLYSLNTSTDYSRVRNHIIVTGSKGNKEHFFDKDLLIACKGHIRTAQIDCPWIDESDGTSAYGAKKVVADKLFFDMKRQARTKNVVVKGNPFIEVLDGCYVYDANTSTAGYYIIKGNTLMGDQNGMINRLELTWETKM